MRRNIFFIFALSFTANVFAQNAAKTDTAAVVYGWKHTLVAMLTLTQASYKDWVQGGDNSLAYTGTIDGREMDDEKSTNWTTSYKFAFGQASLDNLGTRKTDDAINFETIYTLKLDKLINPFVSATLLTQFATGYTYDDSGHATAVSKFFDPGYMTQSAGVGYTPLPEFKTRLGLALREVITSDYNQYADDPNTPEVEKTKVEGGLQSVSELNWKLDDNLLLAMKLSLFDAFKKMDQVIVNSDNSVTAKVSKYISVGLNVQIVNDRSVSTRTQIKEGLGLNLSYTIF